MRYQDVKVAVRAEDLEPIPVVGKDAPLRPHYLRIKRERLPEILKLAVVEAQKQVRDGRVFSEPVSIRGEWWPAEADVRRVDSTIDPRYCLVLIGVPVIDGEDADWLDRSQEYDVEVTRTQQTRITIRATSREEAEELARDSEEGEFVEWNEVDADVVARAV